MNGYWRTKSLMALLDALFTARTHHVLAPCSSGVGAIFMLHHVRPHEEPNEFAPGRYLEITPDFLERAILCARKLGHDIIGLDEVHRRIVQRDFDRKFVCFTLDDGYIDNFDYAFPVFQGERPASPVWLEARGACYAAWAAQRQGRSSSIRLILWSAMRPRTAVSQACGSTPLSLAVSIRV